MTARYALLLRGVNVGTKNTLPMAELKKMLVSVGCADVQTYVQSGNAVFATKRPTAALMAGIEAALSKYMGRAIATTLRTRAELAGVVAARPFGALADDHARLCVTFPSHVPTPAEIAPLEAHDFGQELFLVSGKEIYTWHPNGQGRSALAATLAKLRLRGAVTTRNWNTVLKLLEMLATPAS
jgi:uncharacterized protein (DUF1697 family)